MRLPLANGVARVERSIAFETKKIGVAASGTVDLRSETLDLSVKPRVKAGVTVKLLELASLVHVRGPLAAPTVGVDAVAGAETVARLGAAYATAGLSVLGETLLSGVVESGAECAAALGHDVSGAAAAKGKAAAPSTAPATPAAAKKSDPTGGLFGLFRKH